jgi:hypothetical protein
MASLSLSRRRCEADFGVTVRITGPFFSVNTAL